MAAKVVPLEWKSDHMRKRLLIHDGERVLLQQVPFPRDTLFYGPLLTAFRRPDARDMRMVTRVGPFVEYKYPRLKPVLALTLRLRR